MKKITNANYITMPWKNGSGVTTQLAIEPPDACLDSFGWRISTAQVAEVGPFSMFAGVDRSISVLLGIGLTLELDGIHTATLTPETQPFVFGGEQHVDATLLDGPVSDFNVMTRRAQWAHELQVIQVCGTLHWALNADQSFIYCARGASVLCRNARESEIDLAPGDAVLIEGGDGSSLALSAATDSRLYIVSLHTKVSSDAQVRPEGTHPIFEAA